MSPSPIKVRTIFVTGSLLCAISLIAACKGGGSVDSPIAAPLPESSSTADKDTLSENEKIAATGFDEAILGIEAATNKLAYSFGVYGDPWGIPEKALGFAEVRERNAAIAAEKERARAAYEALMERYRNEFILGQDASVQNFPEEIRTSERPSVPQVAARIERTSQDDPELTNDSIEIGAHTLDQEWRERNRLLWDPNFLQLLGDELELPSDLNLVKRPGEFLNAVIKGARIHLEAVQNFTPAKCATLRTPGDLFVFSDTSIGISADDYSEASLHGDDFRRIGGSITEYADAIESLMASLGSANINASPEQNYCLVSMVQRLADEVIATLPARVERDVLPIARQSSPALAEGPDSVQVVGPDYVDTVVTAYGKARMLRLAFAKATAIVEYREAQAKIVRDLEAKIAKAEKADARFTKLVFNSLASKENYNLSQMKNAPIDTNAFRSFEEFDAAIEGLESDLFAINSRIRKYAEKVSLQNKAFARMQLDQFLMSPEFAEIEAIESDTDRIITPLRLLDSSNWLKLKRLELAERKLVDSGAKVIRFADIQDRARGLSDNEVITHATGPESAADLPLAITLGTLRAQVAELRKEQERKVLLSEDQSELYRTTDHYLQQRAAVKTFLSAEHIAELKSLAEAKRTRARLIVDCFRLVNAVKTEYGDLKQLNNIDPAERAAAYTDAMTDGSPDTCSQQFAEYREFTGQSGWSFSRSSLNFEEFLVGK